MDKILTNHLTLNTYSWEFLLFYFCVYSFFGWILENAFNLLVFRNFFKDGFLFGPFKPMYGFSTVLLLLYSCKYPSWLAISALALLIPSSIEFTTAILLKKFFNLQYWDYTNLRFNFKGYISLRFCFFWLILSILGLLFIHPILSFIYYKTNTIISLLIPVFVSYLSADLFLTFKYKFNMSYKNIEDT